jgi:hypothetical protein
MGMKLHTTNISVKTRRGVDLDQATPQATSTHPTPLRVKEVAAGLGQHCTLPLHIGLEPPLRAARECLAEAARFQQLCWRLG